MEINVKDGGPGNSDFELANAERMAAENPEHFRIPALSKRMGRRVGHSVKLGFLKPGQGRDGERERLWVRIEEVKSPGIYWGTIQNKPAAMRTLRHGYPVLFTAANIFDIEDGT